MINKQKLNLAQRAASPTPKFFRIVRTIGLSLTAIGGAILTAPVAVPALITTIAGYATVIGGSLAAVAQVTVEGD